MSVLQSRATSEWDFASSDAKDELAQLHFYSIQIPQGETGDRRIEFRITVYEYAVPNHLSMRFYAETDKQTNQKTAPFTPCGWGQTLLEALSLCVNAARRFPYEP